MKSSFKFRSLGGAAAVPYEIFKLSAQLQDSSFTRTILAHAVYEFLEIPVPDVEPVALYFNGGYYGLYLLIEAMEEPFYRRREVDLERLYKSRARRADFRPKTIHDPWFAFEPEFGGLHPHEIQRLAAWAADPPGEKGRSRIAGYVDLENAIRYFAALVFLQDCDGYDNNIYLFKARGDERLRFAAWDWEQAYVDQCPLERLLEANRLFARMLDYPELRKRFLATLELLLDTFPAEELQRRSARISSRVRDAYRNDWYLHPLHGGPEGPLRELHATIESWHERLGNAVSRGMTLAYSAPRGSADE